MDFTILDGCEPTSTSSCRFLYSWIYYNPIIYYKGAFNSLLPVGRYINMDPYPPSLKLRQTLLPCLTKCFYSRQQKFSLGTFTSGLLVAGPGGGRVRTSPAQHNTAPSFISTDHTIGTANILPSYTIYHPYIYLCTILIAMWNKFYFIWSSTDISKLKSGQSGLQYLLKICTFNCLLSCNTNKPKNVYWINKRFLVKQP